MVKKVIDVKNVFMKGIQGEKNNNHHEAIKQERLKGELYFIKTDMSAKHV